MFFANTQSATGISHRCAAEHKTKIIKKMENRKVEKNKNIFCFFFVVFLLCMYAFHHVISENSFHKNQNKTKRNETTNCWRCPNRSEKCSSCFRFWFGLHMHMYICTNMYICALYMHPRNIIASVILVFFFLASAAVPNHKSHNSWARGKASWSLGPPAYPYISEFYRIYLVHTYVLAHLILVPWVRPMTPTNFDRTLVYRGVAFATSSFCPFRIHYVGTRFLFQKKKLDKPVCQ